MFLDGKSQISITKSQMVRQAVRQAHGPEQSRRTHHPEPSRRANSKFQLQNDPNKLFSRFIRNLTPNLFNSTKIRCALPFPISAFRIFSRGIVPPYRTTTGPHSEFQNLFPVIRPLTRCGQCLPFYDGWLNRAMTGTFGPHFPQNPFYLEFA